MAAADAETPAGSHQGCQMKKYVLTKVINQITARRARPIYNDLQGRFSAHRSARQKQKTADGRKVYHSGLWQVQVASWCARAHSASHSRSSRKLQSFSYVDQGTGSRPRHSLRAL